MNLVPVVIALNTQIDEVLQALTSLACTRMLRGLVSSNYAREHGSTKKTSSTKSCNVGPEVTKFHTVKCILGGYFLFYVAP